MRGDVDGDGKITKNDVQLIMDASFDSSSLTSIQKWCADVNIDGSVDATDMTETNNYISGLTSLLTSTPTFADYYNNWTYHKVDDLTGYWIAEIAINGLKATSDAIVNIGNDEGIFYKSELSDGAIRFYTTRPPIAEVPATITFKSGTGVITTSYESAKFHASTHSKDGADPITPESIGALSLSGGTMTGPLTLKRDPAGDLEATTKQYVDNHTSDVVLYTSQTLTDDQKTQARGNIGAAPDGYGLGNSEPRYATTDTAGPYSADTMTENCFFVAKTNTPTGDWCYGLCISRSSSNKIQMMWNEQGSGPQSHDGCYAERIMKAGIWGPWEWVNPPMTLGVEYRTTERYQGKPVYTKAVKCGYMTNGKTVEIVSHAYRLIDCRLKGNPQMFPMLPESDTTLSEWSGGFVCGGESITLCAGSRLAASNHSAIAIAKYIDA